MIDRMFFSLTHQVKNNRPLMGRTSSFHMLHQFEDVLRSGKSLTVEGRNIRIVSSTIRDHQGEVKGVESVVKIRLPASESLSDLEAIDKLSEGICISIRDEIAKATKFQEAHFNVTIIPKEADKAGDSSHQFEEVLLHVLIF